MVDCENDNGTAAKIQLTGRHLHQCEEGRRRQYAVVVSDVVTVVPAVRAASWSGEPRRVSLGRRRPPDGPC